MSKNISWLTLPRVLLFVIHNFLPLDEHLVKCRCVCAHWRTSFNRTHAYLLGAATEARLHALAQLLGSHLHTLELCEPAANLEVITRCTSLQCLSLLRVSSIDRATAQKMASLTHLHTFRLHCRCGEHLTRDIRKRECRDLALDILFQSMPFLKFLHLEVCTLSTLAVLQPLHRLLELSLPESFLTPLGLSHLSSLKLQSLGLMACCEATGVRNSDLIALPHFGTTLTHLSLENRFEVTDEALLLFPALQALESLNLGHTHVTSAGLVHLTTLHRLKELDLQSTAVTGSGALHLTRLTNLTALNLGFCSHWTDMAMANLALPCLKRLSLRACAEITDGAMEHIAKLQRLQVLNLQHCICITATGLGHLRSLDLLELYLFGCRSIGNAGCACLAAFHLEVLCMAHTNISEEGLRHLSQLTTLKELAISRFAISEEGVRNLAQVRRLKVGRRLISEIMQWRGRVETSYSEQRASLIKPTAF
jgi:hypothetical protein